MQDGINHRSEIVRQGYDGRDLWVRIKCKRLKYLESVWRNFMAGKLLIMGHFA